MAYGADVNCRNKMGQTPIFYASSVGSSANLIELLDYGHADVNIEANHGKTALSLSKTFETTLTLLNYNADTTNHYIGRSHGKDSLSSYT